MPLTLTNEMRNFAVRTMKTVLFSICLLLFTVAPAQDSLYISRPAFLSVLTTYDLARSYGFSLLACVPFHSTIRHLEKRSKADRETNDFMSAELRAERSPFAYSSIFAGVGVGIRFIKTEKHFTELSINQGVVRTIYDGIVYQLQPDGNLKERTWFGRTYASTGISYSQDWSVSRQNTLFIQIRPSSWIQYPYNSFFRIHLGLQVGASYHFRDIPLRVGIKGHQSS